MVSELDHFWQSIFFFLLFLVFYEYSLNLLLSLFGVSPPNTHFSPEAKKHHRFASLKNWWIFLLRWKENHPTIFKMWVNYLLHLLVLEKICYSTGGRVQKFHTSWRPFLNYIDWLDITSIGDLPDWNGISLKYIQPVIVFLFFFTSWSHAIKWNTAFFLFLFI